MIKNKRLTKNERYVINAIIEDYNGLLADDEREILDDFDTFEETVIEGLASVISRKITIHNGVDGLIKKFLVNKFKIDEKDEIFDYIDYDNYFSEVYKPYSDHGFYNIKGTNNYLEIRDEKD